jgi:glycine/D-amino acid oxidase-like deaminating enzyme
MSIAVAPQAIPLQGDERCDVVVVGSGIAGLSTAYELSERGRSVIVIDRGPIAGGMTARTSAHLAPLSDDLMSEMQKIKGEDQSKLFYALKRYRRAKGSIAIFAASTATCFRATICRLT